MKLSNKILLIFTVVILAACGGKKSSTATPPNPKPKVTNTIELERVWSKSLGGSFKKDRRGFQLSQDDSTIYGATASGKFAAFDKLSGKRIWSESAKKDLSAGISVGFDSVYIANSNGQVLSHDKESGKLKWQSQLKSEVLVAPVEAANIVIVRSQDGRILGLDAETGEQKWALQRDLPSLSLRLDIAPVVSGNVALIGLSNGQLLAIDTQIGRALWDLPISLPTGVNELERMRDIAGQPLVDQTTVFLNNFQGDIASVDGRNRRVNWSKKISSHQQMSGDGSAIYTTASDSSIVALDKETGNIIWQNDNLFGRGVSGPSVIGDHILVFGNDGDMYLFTKDTGQLVGNYSFPGKRVIGTPIFSKDKDTNENLFYALSDNGTIYSYRLKTP